ncbi:MAG: hypothetical protein ACXVCX_18330, partial [Ktedonobacterales bacterium]
TTPPAPLSPKQAWGNYSATHITLPLATTSFFAPKDIFPDGSAIAGVGNHGGQMQVMLLQVATGDTSVLYTAPSDLSTTFDVRTDGRFVAWAGGNEGEGAQSEHNVVGYSDVQSGNVTMLDDANHPEGIVQLTHGTLVWTKFAGNAATSTIVATDLATNTTTTLPITPDWNCGSASWPYLLCEQTNNMSLWKLYNLETHQTTTPTSLSSLTQGTNGYMVALEGTTAFALPTGGSSVHAAQLTEIDQIDQPSAKAHGLGLNFVASGLMANSRLVVWTGNRDGSASINYLYVWDRAQNREISFDPQQFQNTPQFVVRDHAAMIISWSGNSQGDITVINTDILPKTPGA